MFIIDTHIMLWSIISPELLTKKETEIIQNIDNKIFVSTASVWECGIKSNLGKLKIPDDLINILRRSGFQSLPINDSHAIIASSLPSIHNDPFDRLIIAQAIHEKFILITRDDIIKKYSVRIL